MNTKEIAAQIAQSLAPCVACGELIDTWPDADPSEPGMRVIYSARDALFAGICSAGHINEFNLAEAKAGEFVAHDLTERTLGRFVPQDECKHEKSRYINLPDGQTVPSSSGMIVGPEIISFCGLCGNRSVRRGKAKK